MGNCVGIGVPSGALTVAVASPPPPIGVAVGTGVSVRGRLAGVCVASGVRVGRSGTTIVAVSVSRMSGRGVLVGPGVKVAHTVVGVKVAHTVVLVGSDVVATVAVSVGLTRVGTRSVAVGSGHHGVGVGVYSDPCPEGVPVGLSRVGTMTVGTMIVGTTTVGTTKVGRRVTVGRGPVRVGLGTLVPPGLTVPVAPGVGVPVRLGRGVKVGVCRGVFVRPGLTVRVGLGSGVRPHRRGVSDPVGRGPGVWLPETTGVCVASRLGVTLV